MSIGTDEDRSLEGTFKRVYHCICVVSDYTFGPYIFMYWRSVVIFGVYYYIAFNMELIDVIKANDPYFI